MLGSQEMDVNQPAFQSLQPQTIQIWTARLFHDWVIMKLLPSDRQPAQLFMLKTPNGIEGPRLKGLIDSALILQPQFLHL